MLHVCSDRCISAATVAGHGSYPCNISGLVLANLTSHLKMLKNVSGLSILGDGMLCATLRLDLWSFFCPF